MCFNGLENFDNNIHGNDLLDSSVENLHLVCYTESLVVVIFVGGDFLSSMRGWPTSGAVNHRPMGDEVTPLVGASAADMSISCIMSSKQSWIWGSVSVESEIRLW